MKYKAKYLALRGGVKYKQGPYFMVSHYKQLVSENTPTWYRVCTLFLKGREKKTEPGVYICQKCNQRESFHNYIHNFVNPKGKNIDTCIHSVDDVPETKHIVEELKNLCNDCHMSKSAPIHTK